MFGGGRYGELRGKPAAHESDPAFDVVHAVAP